MRSWWPALAAISSVFIAACATTAPGRLARANIVNGNGTALPSLAARYDSAAGTCTAGSIQLLSSDQYQALTEGWKAPRKKCSGPTKRALPTFGDYPRAWQKARADGSAQVLVRLGVDGTIESVRAVCATDLAFGEAAVATASKIRFAPMTCDSQPTRVAFLLPMDYEI